MKLLAIIGAGWLFLAATGHVPFQWTMRLSDTCAWHRRGFWAVLGRGSPDTAAAAAEWRCWARRGAHDPSPLPTVHVLLRKWPSPAELAALNGDTHANQGPLPAGE